MWITTVTQKNPRFISGIFFKIDYLAFFDLRRETIKLFEYFFGERVLRPPVTFP